MTKKRPDLAIQDKNTGKPWKDYKGDSYLNPYKHEVWEYIVEVAEDAARRGFREIQFDYVRFPAGQDGDLTTDQLSRASTVRRWMPSQTSWPMRDRVWSLSGVWVSADVFGYVVDTGLVKGIGQDLRMMCRNIDLICPMVYPDHYELGAFGIEYPPAEPYKLIKKAWPRPPDGSRARAQSAAPGSKLTTTYCLRKLDYTPAMVKEEIKAAAELGFDEYLLWGGYPNVGG